MRAVQFADGAVGMFFDPNLRTVNDFGVDFVMNHFFSGDLAKLFPKNGLREVSDLDVMCDESLLDRH